MKIPITVVTGYLGSGKTTLLRKLVEESGLRLAIIMNEFGEIAIDSKVVKGKNIDMIELAGGCVCCSMTGEFELAIKEILQKVTPDWIVLETTGVAEPDAIIGDLENLEGVKLDAVVTVVDAASLIRFPSIGHTGKIQIELADIILLNKVDLIEKDQIQEIKQKITSINNSAIIYPTSYCDVDFRLLFGVETKKVHEKKVRHDHIIVEQLESFIFTSDKIFDKEKFESFASFLPKEIYRSKGFIRFKDGFYLFNFVAGRWYIEEFSDDKTKIVFIGKDILKFEKNIRGQLKECEI